ncbi:unnamed protein product [Clonostachys rosea]|uniref:Post-SET domain-containing protein n=1 Tax=Bionectria ochroleuca TaxID=29856 RepID=A0ABY6UI43_BIOOC|nr:unnamed protein product [Clonostachys rosea]
MARQHGVRVDIETRWDRGTYLRIPASICRCLGDEHCRPVLADAIRNAGARLGNPTVDEH